MDGKEDRPLKELTTAKGDEGRTRARPWLMVLESRSLCDGNHLLRDYTEYLFILSWNTEEGKRICVVTDRRIRDWFCFGYILLSLPLD